MAASLRKPAARAAVKKNERSGYQMTTKYIQYFPKPVLDDLVSGRWLPVVGAGMSMNARLPTTKKMPLWSGLGQSLAAELPDYESHSALDVISAYQHEFGRATLIERLTEILLVKEAQPGNAHRAFCSIPFDIVCTTNFDFLLERQYGAIPRHAYPVVDEDQLSINGPAAGTLLLKLHGDLHHPSRLVVTEEDYDGFLGRYPLIATYLSNQLITKTAVFIGYSLDDPDFRQIWTVVSDRLGRTRRMAYTLVVDARASDIARFERRGVKAINLPGSKDRYGEVLAEAFDELREYMRDNVISVSQVTEERSLRELLLPRDTTNRLCFFSIPVELVSLYRSRVFPVVEQIGFVPVTAEDVISPGDNINAKIDALIDRASVMVVELTTEWTRAEFDMAIARSKGSESQTHHRQPLRMIVVSSDVIRGVSSGVAYTVIRRPSLLTEEADEFVETLAHQLGSIAEELGLDLPDEAHRLFEARQYRAAVISAMSRLEVWMRGRLEKSQWTDVRRPASLRQLAELVANQGSINYEDVLILRKWINVRNQAVHTDKPVSRGVALEIVEGVSKIINATG